MQLTASDVWTLASTALVLIMTPGLALFYGGLTRSKNMIATMTQIGAVAALVPRYTDPQERLTVT